MPIRILPDRVVAKIAAGEVVERPVSVVKELIENAIDASADEIRIWVEDGGRRSIRVADNGCGIPAEEVPLAFARHATSKLSSEEDLARITTLGFRGEALASIAAVSRVTMVTRAEDEETGTRIRVVGGKQELLEPVGVPRGTVVTVEQLFFNVPARLKFLRSPATERSHIDALVIRYAMAYPGIRFALHHNSRLTFQSPGNGELRDVLVRAYGVEVAEHMIPVDDEGSAPIHVYGYVSDPSLHRSNRDYLTLFVNGRWIRDQSLAYAVEQAYHTLLPTGRHPIAVVHIALPPAQVDVNVHPTKSEVKFADARAVFRAVQRAVRHALTEGSSPVTRQVPQWEETRQRRQTLLQVGTSTSEVKQLAWSPMPEPTDEIADEATALPSTLRPVPSDAASRRLPPLRILGQVAQTYIVAEGPEGLYLIDQHAAHERVLYEQLTESWARREVTSQSLLDPLPVELSPDQVAILTEHLDLLASLGFDLEPFGPQTILVRAIPALLVHSDPREVLHDVVDALGDDRRPLVEREEARLIATVCKRGAVKAGQTLSMEEMRALIEALEATRMPRTCPHGRPTMILLTKTQVEREFGRG